MGRNLTNHALARMYAANCGFPLMYESATNTYWRYADGFWSMLDDDLIIYARREKDGFDGIRRYFVAADPTSNASRAKYSDILDQLRGECDYAKVIRPTHVAFDDCLLDPVTGRREPHSRERVALVRVRSTCDGAAEVPSPNLDRFIESICVREDLSPSPEMRDQLQEIAGYALMPKTNRAMAFFFTGAGRNGKGVFLSLVREMLGEQRTSNMTLTDLTTGSFAHAELIGMLANFSDETKVTKEAVSDVFKKLTANDVLTTDVKFKRRVTFRPFAKYFFNVNGVPQFDCFDYAMQERIMPVHFFRRFSETERDYDLADRIIASEMPRFVAWSLDGLRRLVANRMVFTKSAESAAKLEEFRRVSSSVADFFLEFWEPDEVGVPFTEFYAAYEDYTRKSHAGVVKAKRCAMELADIIGPSYRRREGDSVAVCVRCKKKSPDPQLPPL